MNNLTTGNQQAEQQRRIALPTIDSIHFEQTDRIVYMQADGNYTVLHLKDGSSLLVSQSLHVLENKLEGIPNFFRIHRRHIINLHYLVRYDRGRGGQVIMNCGIAINVSVRRKDSLIQIINQSFC